MNAPLFRHESIESGRQKLAGTVVAAVPPRSRHYSWFAGITILVFALILTFGQYPRRVQVRGIVDYSAGIARVESPSDAKIEQIHVREGQRVAQGTPVATLSLSQGQTSDGAGVKTQLAELDREFQELRRQRTLTSNLSSSERQSLLAQRTSATAAVASLVRQQQLLARQTRINEAQYKRAGRLASKGAGTKQELEQSESLYLASKLNVETLGEKIIGKREEIAKLDAQINGRAINGMQMESQLAERIAGVARERANLARQDRLTLVAPIDGVIGDIALRVGQVASQKAAIVSVIPANSKLEVQLYAPSSAVGFVKPGQQVKLMFDAFPYQKYGTGTGTITWVSSVPTDPPADTQVPAKREPLFRIRVSIDPNSPAGLRSQGTLRPGMTLSANLILEQRNLWEVFLEPMIKAVRA